MKNAKKIGFDKAMNKTDGHGQVFPVLVMTRPSFPCMKPIAPFKCIVRCSI